MAQNPCPVCGQPIAVADLNLAEGVGLCRACGKLSPLKAIAEQPDVQAADVIEPPPGCRYDPPFAGEGTVLTASTASYGVAAYLLAMCLFWNGIVSVFLLVAVGGLYRHFVGPLPAWVPTPEAKDKSMTGSFGMTLFLCLFLTPFVLIGLSLITAFLMSLIGRVEVRVSGTDGRVRTGFGPLNWTRRFDPSAVRRVGTGVSGYQVNDQSRKTIKLDGGDRVTQFGSNLPDRRREWLRDTLHLLLVAPGKESRQRHGLDATR